MSEFWNFGLIAAAFLLGLATSVGVLGLRRARVLREPTEPLLLEVVEVKDPLAAVEHAFAVADQREDEHPAVINNVFPLGPRYEPKTPLPERPMTTKIKIPVLNHPCQHLDGERPGHLQASECSGTCRHQAQEGKLCFWASQTASQCRFFYPRVRAQYKAPPTRAS